MDLLCIYVSIDQFAHVIYVVCVCDTDGLRDMCIYELHVCMYGYGCIDAYMHVSVWKMNVSMFNLVFNEMQRAYAMSASV